MWQNWVNLILAVWIVISPFFFVNSMTSLMWSNVISGIVIGILAVWGASGKPMAKS
jgi:VIT1/CCC1 family predicted Fe2+/Mn2+ transporter